jgi:hypothetical protein
LDVSLALAPTKKAPKGAFLLVMDDAKMPDQIDMAVATKIEESIKSLGGCL